ncbi:ankyrin repeat-containing domain protein [Mycena polygramma]|nr:ankyrin repeat-containing domain protein [Mycena polygramma]
MDYFDELPPELIGGWLSLVTCRRLREVLQPELEARITPALGWRLLLWAAASRPHIVAKLIAPPHSVDPGTVGAYGSNETPHHIATQAGNLEIATLLLAAGADPGPARWSDQEGCTPLHLATMKGALEMVKLLLDRGAPIGDPFGADGCSENALHQACDAGNLSLVTLLLDRGADIERRGHYGTPLAFAVRRSRVDVVQLLLSRDADATVIVPLFPMLEGNPPYPRHANLLYIAMHG